MKLCCNFSYFSLNAYVVISNKNHPGDRSIEGLQHMFIWQINKKYLYIKYPSYLDLWCEEFLVRIFRVKMVAVTIIQS